MLRMSNRALVGSLMAIGVLLTATSQAHAATITVRLVPTSQQVVPVEVTPGTVVTVVRSTWGSVIYNGATIGTYVMRQEFDLPNSTSTTTPFPTPLVTITIRLNPPFATPLDTLIMQGTVPGVAVPGQITIFGNVTVATSTLAFLRGAAFATSVDNGLGVPLTFTY